MDLSRSISIYLIAQTERSRWPLWNFQTEFSFIHIPIVPCVEADPFPLGDGIRFMFDPSGRNIPLFSRRNRPVSISGWEGLAFRTRMGIAKTNPVQIACPRRI
jgi:hypothetical protein